jgi:hypothetical protein
MVPVRMGRHRARSAGAAYGGGMIRQRLLTGLGVLAAVLLGVGFGLSRTIGGVPDAPLSTCDDPTPWEAAADLVGERAAIVGVVAAAAYEPDVGGEPTFVNLGNAHPDPDRFDAVIYPDVRERFDEPPEDMLPGVEVCVQGEIRDRDGVPQIIVDNRAMLQER